VATENAEARAARPRGEERRVEYADSCPAGGVAEEKIASLLFVGSIPHVPLLLTTNHPTSSFVPASRMPL